MGFCLTSPGVRSGQRPTEDDQQSNGSIVDLNEVFSILEDGQEGNQGAGELITIQWLNSGQQVN